MKGTSVLGIALIVLGILSLVYSGITVTREKKILDIGPLQVHTDTKERIPLPPLLGGIALIGGIVLVVTGDRKTA